MDGGEGTMGTEKRERERKRESWRESGSESETKQRRGLSGRSCEQRVISLAEIVLC